MRSDKPHTCSELDHLAGGTTCKACNEEFRPFMLTVIAILGAIVLAVLIGKAIL